MMTEVICAVIAAVATIVAAKVSFDTKKSNERAEENAKLRQRESLLSLRMMDATLQLSVVTSNALTGGHNNGNVERAREAAEKVAADYDEFLRETTAHDVAR